MSCNCGKPKCNGKCGISPAVLQINNPDECTLFHKVTVPASMGDSRTNPPKNGDYKNVLLYFEADETSWLFSSDGIPTQLVNGMTNYEEAKNLPSINNHTLLGNMSGSDLDLQDKLTAGDNIQINGTTISATDTTYGDFVGATSDAAGEAGLVPAPASGVTEKFLKSDGTWSDTTAFLPYPASVNTSGTTQQFIASIQALNAEVGTAFLGTVSLTDLPGSMVQEEVMAYVYDNNLIYLTLRSADVAPYIWSCNSYAYRGWEPIDTTTMTVLWANSTESGATRHLYTDTSMFNAANMGDIITAAHKGLIFARLTNPLTPEQYNESVLVNVWVSPNDNDYQVIFTDGNYTYNYGADALTDTSFAFSSSQYQRKLTAGAGIDITGNTISVKDPAPEDFFDGPATDSDCGTSITLDNIIGGHPESFELKGNTTQNGAPTPSTPVTVRTVTGSQTVSVNGQSYEINLGKNLLDQTTLNTGYVAYDGTIATTGIAQGEKYSPFIKVEPNTTYTFEIFSTTSSYDDWIGYAEYTSASESGFISPRKTASAAYHTFTTGSTTQYIRISARNLAAATEVQLSKGSRTTYAAYFEPIELCKIGDYQDYIYKDGSDWKIHKAIDKAQIDVTSVSSNYSQVTYGFYNKPSNYIGRGNYTDYPVVCEKLQYHWRAQQEQWNSTAFLNMILPNGDQNIMMIGFEHGTSLADAQAAVNDSMMYFPLKESAQTDTTITNEALNAQLDVIKLASGTNTITVTSADLAAELCIEDYVDNWSGNMANIDAELNERVIAFDTVSDMKAADLSAGEHARTLGYHAINDGGGALYKIVDTQPATGHYETLSGSLYASLVYDGSIKPCQYGAYHDGTHDDSDILQECLDDLHEHIYFAMDLQGYKYWIAKPLHLDSTYRATIKNGEINALNTFQIDGEDTEKNYLLYTTNVNNNPSGEVYGGVATEDLKITNITFDCKYVAGLGCLRLRYYLRVNVDLCLFRRYLTEGVKTTNDSSHELVLTNSNFNASLGPNESNSTGVAIVCNGYDNIYSNLIITGGKYGIQHDQAKANMFSKIHIYGQTDYSIYSVSSSQNTYEEMYIDGKGIYIHSPWLITFVNCYFLVSMTPITLDKTGGVTIFGVKFIGCIGTNYSENDIDLITLPSGNFLHCTDCAFDISLTNHINDNRYLVDVPYITKFNKVFINDADADYAMNAGGQIIATTASRYTFTAVNNIIDVSAFDNTGDNWLAFVIPLDNNKTYKCINRTNNTADFRVFGISSLDLWTLGTKIKESTSNKYGYDTFDSGSYSYYLVAVYGAHRFDIEISEA